MPSVPRLVIASFLVLFGSAPLVAGARWLVVARGSAGFATTPGRIVESDFEAQRSPLTTAVAYAPRAFRYAYTVDGVARFGSAVFQVPRLLSPEEKAAFERDPAVTVHYDPARPERAFLVEERDWVAYGARPLGLGLLLCSMAAAALFLGRKPAVTA